MAPRTKLIIDTDVGGDDMIAMLLAMAAPPDQMQVALISAVWGNVNVEKGLRNIVTMFHVLDLEIKWREKQGVPVGFEALRAHRPVVALGCAHALGEQIVEKTDGFHGPDGLHNVHILHPDLSPEDTWRSLFDKGASVSKQDPSYYQYFEPSIAPAHQEILRVLRESPPGTVTVLAVGPMTNIALAAAEDPETFLRMKELLVMGGAVNSPGNITPVAEANTWNDAQACARVFALTSPSPSSTMPKEYHNRGSLSPYPSELSKQLQVKLFPLDITLSHSVDYERFAMAISPQLNANGPLAVFVNTFLSGIYEKVRYQYGSKATARLTLHDPVPMWYALTSDDPTWTLASPEPEDIRIETSGHWTHGMHVLDGRGKRRADGLSETEMMGDDLGWLSAVRGNRISRMTTSPGPEEYHKMIMKNIFSL